MTLHEAIVKVLKTAESVMTTQQIADELNRTKAYQKRDGSIISDYQIHGRTRKYAHLFDRDGSKVSLKGKPNVNQNTVTKITSTIIPITSTNETINIGNIDKTLMNETNFKSSKTIDSIVPSNPGIYCIRIKNIDALPKPFNTGLKERGHNIIYIGIATKSLNKRMLNQELRANGHGTFFRSLGASLGYKPPVGSLINKKNNRNYKFSDSDESRIINWINNNLLVNWIVQNSELEKIETELILKYKPLFNIAKNPVAMRDLSQLRKECVRIANEMNNS